jgi:TetR/AcrR family transcriptional regulator, transcriptional repressor for nem operon
MTQRPAPTDAAPSVRPGRPLAFDHGEALTAITEVFWEHGWTATSTPILEARTGLSRSSLTNSFGTKHQMFCAALALYNDLIERHLVSGLRSADIDPLDSLHAFFDRLAALKADGPGRHGCLIINTIAEIPLGDPVIDGHIQRYRHTLLSGFRSALGRTQARLSLPVDRGAHVLLALAMTINVHARHGDTAAAATTTAAAHDLLDSWAS